MRTADDVERDAPRDVDRDLADTDPRRHPGLSGRQREVAQVEAHVTDREAVLPVDRRDLERVHGAIADAAAQRHVDRQREQEQRQQQQPEPDEPGDTPARDGARDDRDADDHNRRAERDPPVDRNRVQRLEQAEQPAHRQQGADHRQEEGGPARRGGRERVRRRPRSGGRAARRRLPPVQLPPDEAAADEQCSQPDVAGVRPERRV